MIILEPVFVLIVTHGRFNTWFYPFFNSLVLFEDMKATKEKRNEKLTSLTAYKALWRKKYDTCRQTDIRCQPFRCLESRHVNSSRSNVILSWPFEITKTPNLSLMCAEFSTKVRNSNEIIKFICSSSVIFQNS